MFFGSFGLARDCIYKGGTRPSSGGLRYLSGAESIIEPSDGFIDIDAVLRRSRSISVTIAPGGPLIFVSNSGCTLITLNVTQLHIESLGR